MISVLSAFAFTEAPTRPRPAELARVAGPENSFVIQAVSEEGWRWDATNLINKMYGWRGYGSGFKLGDRPGQKTFVASPYGEDSAIGTLTVSVDADERLLADDVYHEQVQSLRDQGRVVSEFIKFAIDHRVRSKRLVAALFHVAFIHAHYVHGSSDLVIEVNPQHELFYRRLLDFEILAQGKVNIRVNAPSVLLHLDLTHAAIQIEKLGGQGESSSERSLYPYFFSRWEDRRIRQRMCSPDHDFESTEAGEEQSMALAMA